MSRPTVVDADGHVQEKYIRWEDYLEEPYRSQAPRVVKDNSGVDFLMVEGKLWPKPSGPGVGNRADFKPAPGRWHARASKRAKAPARS